MARQNSRKRRRDALNIARMGWEDVYQLPIHLDKHGCYAWCKNGTMAITFEHFNELYEEKDWIEGEKKAKQIVSYINGDTECNEKGWTYKDAVDFYLNGKYMFCVRGWGHLTGTGALHLPIQDAERIQDGFVQHIAKQLKATLAL